MLQHILTDIEGQRLYRDERGIYFTIDANGASIVTKNLTKFSFYSDGKLTTFTVEQPKEAYKLE